MKTSIICTICSNGCHLTVESSASGSHISGNECVRGVGFAARELKGTFPKPFSSDLKELSHDDIAEIIKSWNLALERVLPAIPIEGSPERSLFRTVFSAGGARYILEEVELSRFSQRKVICEVMEEFHNQLPLIKYLKGTEGDEIQLWQERGWMVHAYVEHQKLNRGLFWDEKWRGEALGSVLCSLINRGELDVCGSFSVEQYVRKLMRDIKRTKADLFNELTPIVELIEQKLFPELSSLPRSICHGDAHPLNILWGDESLIALIDWEFCGNRPRIYDLALVIGCVGSESPEALDGGFNRSLIETVRNGVDLSDREWQLLPVMIIALRFNWLSEWLRKNDKEMIRFELFYMNHLIERYYPEQLDIQ